MSVENAGSSTDCLILNLNEINVVSASIRRLKREGHNIIVVDSGSDDDSKEILANTSGITFVNLRENKGSSVARNAGLAKSTANYVFLLDGDILYIPGTIPALEELMENTPDAGCIGVHNPRDWDGTQERHSASPFWPVNPGKLYADFDMAWTQYGLFSGDMLRTLGFYAEGVFGEAGVGYEDDWLWHKMKQTCLKSYYLPNVTYYHEKHGGKRWLEAHDMPINDEARRLVFEERWGIPWNRKPIHEEWEKDVLAGRA